jgi:hypothetical protein
MFSITYVFSISYEVEEGNESYLRSQKRNKINKMRGSQIDCHFYFGRVAVLVAVAQK